MEWVVFKDDGRAVHRLPGDFSGLGDGDDLVEKAEALAAGGILVFEIDFAQARYISSLGVAILIRLKKKLVTMGADLRLAQVSKDVRRVLTITRTDEFLLGAVRGTSEKRP